MQAFRFAHVFPMLEITSRFHGYQILLWVPEGYRFEADIASDKISDIDLLNTGTNRSRGDMAHDAEVGSRGPHLALRLRPPGAECCPP